MSQRPSCLPPAVRQRERRRSCMTCPLAITRCRWPPPAGGYGAVDAVAALPWALAIAQAWQGDARLERIDVTRLRPDGTVNLQDDGEASLTYRFVSPGARKALRDQARLRATTEAVVGLWVPGPQRGATSVRGCAAGQRSRRCSGVAASRRRAAGAADGPADGSSLAGGTSVPERLHDPPARTRAGCGTSSLANEAKPRSGRATEPFGRIAGLAPPGAEPSPSFG